MMRKNLIFAIFLCIPIYSSASFKNLFFSKPSLSLTEQGHEALNTQPAAREQTLLKNALEDLKTNTTDRIEKGTYISQDKYDNHSLRANPNNQDFDALSKTTKDFLIKYHNEMLSRYKQALQNRKNRQEEKDQSAIRSVQEDLENNHREKIITYDRNFNQAMYDTHNALKDSYRSDLKPSTNRILKLYHAEMAERYRDAIRAQELEPRMNDPEWVY